MRPTDSWSAHQRGAAATRGPSAPRLRPVAVTDSPATRALLQLGGEGFEDPFEADPSAAIGGITICYLYVHDDGRGR